MKPDETGIIKNIPGTVLIVDDERINCELLQDLLDVSGHQTTISLNGADALARCKEQSFDVILLDVMMPDIDGFRVCRKLKSNSETAHIPVLLVTALKDRKDRLNGIKAGANDFINKPIDGEDVTLRVRNAIHSKRLYDKMQENYRKLQEMESLREDLANMIVHDMRTPLSVIQGALQLATTIDLNLDEDVKQQALVRADACCRNLIEMTSMILDIRRIEENKMPLEIQKHSLKEIVEDAISMLEIMFEKCRIECRLPKTSPVEIACDSELVRRVIINLLGNGVKFTPRGGLIDVVLEEFSDHAKVSVADTGPGIPPEYHEKIFTKFGQVQAKRDGKFYSSGLGLTFCKLAVEAHGGTMGVTSEVHRGSTFWFTIPRADEPSVIAQFGTTDLEHQPTETIIRPSKAFRR